MGRKTGSRIELVTFTLLLTVGMILAPWSCNRYNNNDSRQAPTPPAGAPDTGWDDKITISNAADVVDGNISTPATLFAAPGNDGISLREAINACNGAPGPCEINFSQSLAGKVILLTDGLPPIDRDNVTITGIDGVDGEPAITIDWNFMRDKGGFELSGSHFTMQRLRLRGLWRGGSAGVKVWGSKASTAIVDVHIEDNVFEGSGVRGDGIGITVGSNSPDLRVSDVSILRNEFNSLAGDAIMIGSGGSGHVIEDVLVQGNLFFGNRYPVEVVSCNSRNRFRNLKIIGNRFTKCHQSVTLLAMRDPNSSPTAENVTGNSIEGTLISNNVFDMNGGSPCVGLGAGFGTNVSCNSIIDTQIVNNLMTRTSGCYAVGVSGGTDGARENLVKNTFISGNVFKDNENPCIAISGGTGSGSIGNSVIDTQIVNNLMTGSRRYCVVGIEGGRDEANGNLVSGVRLLNNTIAYNPIVDTGSTAIAVHPNQVPSEGNSIHAVRVQNTIFFDNAWGDFQGLSSDQVDHCVTSQSGFAGVNGNIAGDPKFVNSAEADFHLASGSPAIDAGSSLNSPATDLDGHERTALPDIGALEYVKPETPDSVERQDYSRRFLWDSWYLASEESDAILVPGIPRQQYGVDLVAIDGKPLDSLRTLLKSCTPELWTRPLSMRYQPVFVTQSRAWIMPSSSVQPVAPAAHLDDVVSAAHLAEAIGTRPACVGFQIGKREAGDRTCPRSPITGIIATSGAFV